MKYWIVLTTLWLGAHSQCTRESRLGGQKACILDSVNSLEDLKKLGPSSVYPVLSISELNIASLDKAFFEALSTVANDLYVTKSSVERILLPSVGPRVIWINDAPLLTQLDFEDKDNDLLQEITIESSGIRQLPATISRLKALTFFGLKNGKLEQLNFDLFAQSEKLQVLNFEGNRIRTVESSRNQVIPVGNIIDLGWNHIEHLEMDVFGPMQNMLQLKLDHNNISSITTKDRLNLPELIELSITHNSLTELDVSKWNMPRLDDLSLHKNALTAIHPSMAKLTTVGVLDFGKNALQNVNLEIFSKMTQLILLRLDKNQITEVIAERPIKLPNLTVLKLANNKLSNLDVSNWQFPLKTIDVSANQLRQIEHFPDQLLKLKTVNLLSNPWKCDWLEGTIKKLVSRNVDVKHLSAEDLLCPNSFVTMDFSFKMCCDN